MAKIKSEGGQAANQGTVIRAQQAARASIARGEVTAKAKRAGAQSVRNGTASQTLKKAFPNSRTQAPPKATTPHPINARGGAKVKDPPRFIPTVKLDASQITDRRPGGGTVPKRKVRTIRPLGK